MERNTSDTRLRCMDTALKAADYAAKLRDDFVKAGTNSNPERQVALMNVVIAVFPPGTARRILQAAASEGSTPAVQQRYDEARTDLPSHDDVESCPTSSLVLPGVPKEQTTLAALPTISFTPQNCPPNPPAPPLGLTVFPQIVRPEDKAGAQQILAGLVQLVPNTNVQAIESVPSRSPETAKAEIRYYYRDQADTADRLRKLLAQVGCLEGRGGLGAFEARYIGDRFSNLPRDRMELWFPALNQPN